MISDLQKPIVSGFGQKTEPNEILSGIDLAGKSIIVTGGYSGIGLETTRALKNAGARVIIPAKRVDVAIDQLHGVVDKADIVEMDLGDLNSVQNFANSFNEQNIALDILINNAGIMACPETRINKEWESQFAVNQIGHFLLTRELMDSMKKAKESRLVSLSSSAHSISGIIWDDIHFKANPYDKWIAYGQSKTASSLLAIEFNRLMNDHGGKGFAVHPGGIMHNLVMNFFQNMLSSIMKSRLAFSRSGAEDFGFFHKEINKATESVMSTTGGVSSIAFAEHLLDLIENQDNAPLTYDDCMNKNVEENELMKKTFEYLTKSNRNDELPNDSVARFHLGNGAILKKVNLNADLSEKGINQSYGIMVNYLYDLDVVEENHELFFKTKEVVLSNEMKSFKKKNS